MRLIALAAVSALTLGACSPQTAEPAPAAPAEPAPMLAGVDLSQPVRVLGTEPFWGIDLNASELVYSGVDRAEQRAPRPEPALQGTVATYEAITTTGTAISIMLAATECSDGMSDRTYPLTARVKVGDEELSGCAAATSAIITGGEGAPPPPPAQPAA
jgi:uncharacterized membrane protein